jgi:NAD(P)-dependent dehydrogenase (short-subunit alcohol dehydrogenase family)
MQIEGKNSLVLGGAGLVGMAVCRELLAHRPALLVVASRRRHKAQQATSQLASEFPETPAHIIPIWGDIFIRAEWQRESDLTRARLLANPDKRRRLIADILEPLDEGIIGSSTLTRIITGSAQGLDGSPAGIVVDCMNTATAVSYQDVYSGAQRLADLTRDNRAETNWPEEIEPFLASLYVPQLVRHVQLLYEAMRRAGTEAYVKVGTSGTGGMGFNIPYTHGEERPSRLLLSKAALAGAQTLLIFLMARTPGGLPIVKEVMPTAVIGWREIAHGPIRRGGRALAVYDCAPDRAVSVRNSANLVAQGDFGMATGDKLEGVYIDTGENGLFSAGEFAAITALGQMQLVTPEDVARNVVRELIGGNTGRDVVGALDGAVMGPSYRGGYLRQTALDQLRRLEAAHGESVAFEILGPPRLSKLLFEASLLKRSFESAAAVLAETPEGIAAALERQISDDADVRRRMLSIGIPILLSDGERLLRGAVIKSEDAHHGWVDLTPANMERWQRRLTAIRGQAQAERGGDTSSRLDHLFAVTGEAPSGPAFFDIGAIVAWIFIHEDQGRRYKD